MLICRRIISGKKTGVEILSYVRKESLSSRNDVRYIHFGIFYKVEKCISGIDVIQRRNFVVPLEDCILTISDRGSWADTHCLLEPMCIRWCFRTFVIFSHNKKSKISFSTIWSGALNYNMEDINLFWQTHTVCVLCFPCPKKVCSNLFSVRSTAAFSFVLNPVSIFAWLIWISYFVGWKLYLLEGSWNVVDNTDKGRFSMIQ